MPPFFLLYCAGEENSQRCTVYYQLQDSCTVVVSARPVLARLAIYRSTVA